MQDSECRPYILPLFPTTDEVMMGRNLTWLCKMVSVINITTVILILALIILILILIITTITISIRWEAAKVL